MSSLFISLMAYFLHTTAIVTYVAVFVARDVIDFNEVSKSFYLFLNV